MTDESQNQPVLSIADRALLKSEAAPSDAQLEATRRAIGTRIAALAAGAAIAQTASTAEATGAAATTGAAGGAAATATQTFAAFSAAKWISAGLIATAVAGGTVVATRSSQKAERPHAAVAHATPAAAPVALAAPATAPEIAAPKPAVIEAPEVIEEPAAPAPTRRAAAQPRRATTAPKAGRPLEGETLSAELSLIHTARQALARHDAIAALQALDTHAARYPNAVLRQEALSARALALCEAGRTADARRTAAQLTRIAPRSPHLIRLADSCAQQGDDPSE